MSDEPVEVSNPLDPKVGDRFLFNTTEVEITAVGQDNVLALDLVTGVEAVYPLATVATWTASEGPYLTSNMRLFEFDTGSERGFSSIRMASQTGRSIILQVGQTWRPG